MGNVRRAEACWCTSTIGKPARRSEVIFKEMSNVPEIDGIITSVGELPDGRGTITLGPRDGKRRIRGRSFLIVENPPEANFNAAIGTPIRAAGDFVYVGITRWAKRIGPMRIHLLDQGEGVAHLRNRIKQLHAQVKAREAADKLIPDGVP